VTAAAALAVTLASGSAFAQSASDQAAAEALFKQGRGLMTAGQYADACPKFAESQRLDPAPGTLLNLATCYERNGQIASAWVTFKEAALVARKAEQSERARLARDKAAELEPELPTLTIVVPAGSDRADLELRRDGEIVGRAEWGVAIPVDPGAHVVDASAPGHKGWQGKTQVIGAGVKQAIEVPVLEPLAALPEAAPPPPPPPDVPLVRVEHPRPSPQPAPLPPVASPGPSAQRVAALVLGGVGLAGLMVGAGFGIAAAIDQNDATGECVSAGTGVVCNLSGYAHTLDAQHAATVATAALAAGGALLAVAIPLYLTAPAHANVTSFWTLSPRVGRSEGGIGLRWTF
jgi:hypothetical protein